MNNKFAFISRQWSLIILAAVVMFSGVSLGAMPSDNNALDRFDRPASQFLAADDKSDALTANAWLWKRYASAAGPIDIEQPQTYELKFAKDGTVSIKADCNLANGRFTINGETLSIMIGPSTLAICPGASKGEQFLQLLGSVKRFALAGENLILFLKDDSAMSLAAPTITDRCGARSVSINKIADTLDPKVSEALDQKLLGFVKPGFMSAPGASMLVITPTGRYLKSVGLANVGKCEQLLANSPFQIGSNTKMMTAAMIYQLQEKRQLAASDPISKYLPELASRLVNGKEITIDMLLSHTSGLADYFDINNGDGGIAGGVSNKSILTRSYTPEELVRLVADSGKSSFKPGESDKWKYSNTGYVLLGLIIEKVTKRSYEENLKSRILKPLKLKKTYLQPGQPSSGALPQAYYQQPFTFTTDEWNASQGWAAGAVVSTSEEFAVFLKALFSGRLFKNKGTLALMQASTTGGKGALGGGTVYGHGMLNNNGVLGHGGETLGFQSDGGYIPNKDVTIVIWANSALNNVNRLAVPKLAEIVLGVSPGK